MTEFKPTFTARDLAEHAVDMCFELQNLAREFGLDDLSQRLAAAAEAAREALRTLTVARVPEEG